MSTREALRLLLQSDHENGTLPIGRSGKIERKGYAGRLAITKSAMSFYGDIFVEFDCIAGSLPRAVRLIPEIKARYLELLELGLLQVGVDGRVSRRQLLEEFHIGSGGGTPLRRYPALREMFLELDQDAAQRQYKPSLIEQNISKIENLLATGDFDDLDNGRVTMAPLLRTMGFAEGLPPVLYRGVVYEHERRLREKLTNDPLVFELHRRFYSFRFLVENGWDFERALKVPGVFKSLFDSQTCDRLESVRIYSAARSVLTFLSSEKTPACRGFKKSVGLGIDLSVPTDVLWAVVLDYQSQVLGAMNENTANGYVVHTNKILAHLANHQVLPHIPYSLSKYDTPGKTSRRSIVENAVTAPMVAEQAVAFAATVLENDDDEARFFLDDNDTAGFLDALRNDFHSSTALASGDLVAAILSLLDRRLEALSKHFWAIFEKWRAHYKLGQLLVSEGLDPATYWDDDFIQGGYRDRVLEYFPIGENRRQGAANLLRLIRDVFKGRVPSPGDPSFPYVLRRRLKEYGGTRFLMAYLRPHNDLVGALIGLYLNESGANVAVARTLLRTCIRDTDEPGYKLVFGHKTRARGKAIVVYLKDDGYCVQSMSWWRERIGQFLPAGTADSEPLMFTLCLKGEIQPVSFKWLRDWYVHTAKQIDGFEEVECLPSSMRPSILLKSVLDHDGEIRHAITLAQHTEGVANAYYDRFPVRFMHVAELRNFNRITETIAVHRIPGGPAYIGLGDQELQGRLDEFVETGLGPLCQNPLGHPTGHGETCKTLDCWQCPNAIVVAEPAGIASLIIWRTALLDVEGDWVRDQPDRWERYYLPWISFADVVEEKMQTGELADIWDEASLLAQQSLSHPNFRPYLPWS
ncbi:hypothetical protein LZK82_16765 [Rhizobium leguminosarum]|nr:hypothetical protein LZK82_16765 [Rhizobium leguminosarum]